MASANPRRVKFFPVLLLEQKKCKEKNWKENGNEWSKSNRTLIEAVAPVYERHKACNRSSVCIYYPIRWCASSKLKLLAIFFRYARYSQPITPFSNLFSKYCWNYYKVRVGIINERKLNEKIKTICNYFKSVYIRRAFKLELFLRNRVLLKNIFTDIQRENFETCKFCF